MSENVQHGEEVDVMLKDHDDGGITRISISNLEKFASVHGRDKVRAIIVNDSLGPANTIVGVYFIDGAMYVASGFGCGHNGEGPAGLYETIRSYLNRTDITQAIIASWKEKVYLVMRGAGSLVSGGPGRRMQEFILSGYNLPTMEIW